MALSKRLWVTFSAVAVVTASCATVSPAGPTHFYASWSGLHPPTQAIFDAVDGQMRLEPALVRAFDDAMNVHIDDGLPVAEGQMRYRIRMVIPSRLLGRRIREKDRKLAEFSVTCLPDRPQPCRDEILSVARRQPTRIGRIVARAPKASPQNRMAGPRPATS
jgi:hypothetical protein